MVEYPHGQVRAVTHYGVTAADIETTIAATRAALAETSRDRSRPSHRRHGLTHATIAVRTPPADPASTAAPPTPPARRRSPQPRDRSTPCRRRSRDPPPAPAPGPLDDRVLRPRRDAASSGSSATTRSSAPRSACTRTTTCSATAAATRSSPSSTPTAPTSPRSRRSTRPTCPRRPAFERDLELHNVRRAIFDTDVLRLWERRSFALDTIGDGLFLLFARDHAPARRAARRHRRPARGRRRLPRGGQDPGNGPAGPPLAADRDRDRGRAAVLLRRARRGRRRRRCRPPSSAASSAPASRPRSPSSCTRPGSRARSRTAPTSGRSGASATTRWSACGPSTGSMPTRSSSSAGSSCAEEHAARAAAAREIDPDADEATVIDRVKSDQPADVRRGPRRLPRRDAPGPPAPHRARPRDGPRRRADRRHRDARVPAQRRPVRGLLRAGRLRPRSEGDLRRDAVGRRRPERDARAQLRLDQQHEHPRGVPGPSPPARRRPPEPVADPAADRRPGVRRGLGDVLRADDARARASTTTRASGWPCTPTRSGGPAGSSSTSGCTAAS